MVNKADQNAVFLSLGFLATMDALYYENLVFDLFSASTSKSKISASIWGTILGFASFSSDSTAANLHSYSRLFPHWRKKNIIFSNKSQTASGPFPCSATDLRSDPNRTARLLESFRCPVLTPQHNHSRLITIILGYPQSSVETGQFW